MLLRWICFAQLILVGLLVGVGSLAADEAILAPALKPFVESHTLAGAVTLVASPDKVLSLEAVGFADIGANKQLKTDDLFWIASMSKPITATAVMLLVDEGKLNLDEPIEKYLPEFKDQWLIAEKDAEHVLLKRPATKVTLRHLLSHTSGMPFKSILEEPTLDQLKLKDTVRGYALLPLQTEPGTKYQYSNAGINTAGRIVEVVSGISFEEFLDTRLFQPLGMTDTTFWPSVAQVDRLAKAYQPNATKDNLQEITISQLTYPLPERSRQPMPGGGLFSTASDVAKFGQMVVNLGKVGDARLMSEAAVKEMTKRQTAAGIPDSYGLGWSAHGDTCGHGGALSTNLTVDFRLKLVTVFMVQHAGYPNADGGKIYPTFIQTAQQKFGK